MKKQIIFVVLCLMAVSLLLPGCTDAPDDTQPETVPDDSMAADIAVEDALTETDAPEEVVDDTYFISPAAVISPYPVPEWLADIKSNWAWAISNGGYEIPGDQLVAEEYSSPEILENLTMAVGADGPVSIRYTGEKQGSGKNRNYEPWLSDYYFSDYHRSYGSITGFNWQVTAGVMPVGQHYYLLLPASYKDGLVPFTPAKAAPNEAGGLSNHGHPAATPADVAKIEALKNGRKVMHSELLATDANGGRVALFQFTNTDYGMFILAYIHGDRVITKEFIGGAWAADADADDICEFELIALYETGGKLVLGYVWYRPESVIPNLLAEDNGKFIDFTQGAWYYDIFNSKYGQSSFEPLNSELWPELDPDALVGTWEGESYEGNTVSYTFYADGNGSYSYLPWNDNNSITWYVDGNMLICKDINDLHDVDFYRIRIVGNQLIAGDGPYMIPVLTKQENL